MDALLRCFVAGSFRIVHINAVLRKTAFLKRHLPMLALSTVLYSTSIIFYLQNCIKKSKNYL